MTLMIRKRTEGHVMPNGWILALALIACQDVPDARVQDRASILRAFEQAPGPAGVEIDELVLGPDDEPSSLLVLVGSSGTHRHVTIFISDDRLTKAKEYRPEISFELDRHGKHWMVPEIPRFADLDRDGRSEVVLGFRCLLADRTSSRATLAGVADAMGRVAGSGLV